MSLLRTRKKIKTTKHCSSIHGKKLRMETGKRKARKMERGDRDGELQTHRERHKDREVNVQVEQKS
jgi:hypothetical protein